jgi:hypothetical protein
VGRNKIPFSRHESMIQLLWASKTLVPLEFSCPGGGMVTLALFNAGRIGEITQSY